MPRNSVIGVDLGGTNVRAGSFYADGTPAGKVVSNPSHGQQGAKAILRAVIETIRAARDGAERAPVAVGLAVPGFADDEAGVLRWAPNLGETVDGSFRYIEDLDARTPIEAELGLPVYLNNDANLAALGEYRFGSGRDRAACLVMLTLGTGIGGGVVLGPGSALGNAQGPLLLLGGNKGGVELGHMVMQHRGLDCNAGTYGALEAYAQRDSIVRRAQHRLRRGRASSVRDLIGDDIAAVTPRHLAEAAEQGDELALEIWAEVGDALGAAIGGLINIFAPEVVAIGGQIAKVGEPLLGPARRTARNIGIPPLFDFARIVQAEQIDEAGLLGAAALASMRAGLVADDAPRME